MSTHPPELRLPRLPTRQPAPFPAGPHSPPQPQIQPQVQPRVQALTRPASSAVPATPPPTLAPPAPGHAPGPRLGSRPGAGRHAGPSTLSLPRITPHARQLPHRLPAARGPRLAAAYALAALVIAVLAAATAGVFERVWYFLDWGGGVLALVSLTATVLWGLVATDRLVLHPGHRLLAQGVHRGLALCGLAFLGLHIWVKIAEERTTLQAAAVPFTDATQPVLIGLGSLACYGFLLAAAVGLTRGAFASRRRSRWWRATHMCAYLAWGACLVHGLRAGRATAGWWVTALYLACLVGAAAALALRVVLRARALAAADSAVPAGAAVARGEAR